MSSLYRHFKWPLGVLVTGLALSLVVYAYLRDLQWATAEASFGAQVQRQVAAVGRTVGAAEDGLLSAADILRVKPDMSRTEFEDFGELLIARQPAFSSLAYSRRVPASGLDPLIEGLRSEGYLSVAGPPQGARGMSMHLILTRIVPASLAPEVIGNDLLALPGRRDAAMRARDEGRVIVTRPLTVGGRSPEQPGILLFAPVYAAGSKPQTVQDRRESFIGTASIALLLEPMLKKTLPNRPDALSRAIVVDASGDEPIILFDQVTGEGEQVDLDQLANTPRARWSEIDFAGRTWRLLFLPTPAFMKLHGSNLVPGAILSLGTLISLLLAAIVVLQQRGDRAKSALLREREAVASELAAANEALEVANEEMEMMISTVSHDLRTPLQTVLTVADILKMISGEQGRDVGRAADRLGRAAEAMIRITQGLLDHSRAGGTASTRKNVDLADIVAVIVAQHGDTIADSGAQVSVHDLPVIDADGDQLATALDNLLTNALKYANPPDDQRQPRIEIGSRMEQDEILLYVSDNGPGVSEEHREHVFQAFRRLNDEHSGTGLGLAIVDRIARAHGGRAWVEETPGGGATFVISIARQSQTVVERPDS